MRQGLPSLGALPGVLALEGRSRQFCGERIPQQGAWVPEGEKRSQEKDAARLAGKPTRMVEMGQAGSGGPRGSGG